MEEMRKKNEEFTRRHAEVERDRIRAEENNQSVTNVRIRKSSTSSIENEVSEAVTVPVVNPKPVYTREWDMNKTADMDDAWEPTTEGWKSGYQRVRRNGPERRFNDRTRDFSDKKGTYVRQGQRFQNSFQPSESRSRFRGEEDTNPPRERFTATNRNQQMGENRIYSRGRGRARDFRPRVSEDRGNNARSSSSFDPTTAAPPPHDHDIRMNKVDGGSSSSSDEDKKVKVISIDSNKGKSSTYEQRKDNWPSNQTQVLNTESSPMKRSDITNTARNIRQGSRFLSNCTYSSRQNQQNRYSDNAHRTISSSALAHRQHHHEEISNSHDKFKVIISSNNKRVVHNPSKSFKANEDKKFQSRAKPFSQEKSGWSNSKEFKIEKSSTCSDEDTTGNQWATSNDKPSEKLSFRGSGTRKFPARNRLFTQRKATSFDVKVRNESSGAWDDVEPLKDNSATSGTWDNVEPLKANSETSGTWDDVKPLKANSATSSTWDDVKPLKANSSNSVAWDDVKPLKDNSATSGTWDNVKPLKANSATSGTWDNVKPLKANSATSGTWDNVKPLKANSATSGTWDDVKPLKANSATSGTWDDVKPLKANSANSGAWDDVKPLIANSATFSAWDDVKPLKANSANSGAWDDVQPLKANSATSGLSRAAVEAFKANSETAWVDESLKANKATDIWADVELFKANSIRKQRTRRLTPPPKLEWSNANKLMAESSGTWSDIEDNSGDQCDTVTQSNKPINVSCVDTKADAAISKPALIKKDGAWYNLEKTPAGESARENVDESSEDNGSWSDVDDTLEGEYENADEDLQDDKPIPDIQNPFDELYEEEGTWPDNINEEYAHEISYENVRISVDVQNIDGDSISNRKVELVEDISYNDLKKDISDAKKYDRTSIHKNSFSTSGNVLELANTFSDSLHSECNCEEKQPSICVKDDNEFSGKQNDAELKINTGATCENANAASNPITQTSKVIISSNDVLNSNYQLSNHLHHIEDTENKSASEIKKTENVTIPDVVYDANVTITEIDPMCDIKETITASDPVCDTKETVIVPDPVCESKENENITVPDLVHGTKETIIVTDPKCDTRETISPTNLVYDIKKIEKIIVPDLVHDTKELIPTGTACDTRKIENITLIDAVHDINEAETITIIDPALETEAITIDNPLYDMKAIEIINEIEPIHDTKEAGNTLIDRLHDSKRTENAVTDPEHKRKDTVNVAISDRVADVKETGVSGSDPGYDRKATVDIVHDTMKTETNTVTNSLSDTTETENVAATVGDSKCIDSNDESWDTFSEGTGSEN